MITKESHKLVPFSKKNFFTIQDEDTHERRVDFAASSFEGIDIEKRRAEAELQTPPRDIEGWRWYLVVLSILSSIFLFALDNTIVADIQPVIVTHFSSVSKLSWLSVSFLIGAASTNLVRTVSYCFHNSSSNFDVQLYFRTPRTHANRSVRSGAKYLVNSTENGHTFSVSSCSKLGLLFVVPRQPWMPSSSVGLFAASGVQACTLVS
jgi:hypothetical protein